MDAANVQAAPALKWYEVWSQVYLHPSVGSFLRILADPNAKADRAYIWAAASAVMTGLLQGYVYSLTGRSGFGLSGSFLTLGCGLIFAPVAAGMGLAIIATIIHWTAERFGGKGTYDHVTYAFGAIEAPATLISALFSVLLLLIFPGYAETLRLPAAASMILAPFSLAWAVYLIVLQVLAIKAAEKLDTGKAILTFLSPAIGVIILVGGCWLLTFPMRSGI